MDVTIEQLQSPDEDRRSHLYERIALDLQRSLDAWQSAWQRKDSATYLGSYAPGFEPEYGLSRADWENSRSRRMAMTNNIQVSLEGVRGNQLNDSTYETRFTQHFNGDQKYSVKKLLVWQRNGGRWQILKEGVTQ